MTQLDAALNTKSAAEHWQEIQQLNSQHTSLNNTQLSLSTLARNHSQAGRIIAITRPRWIQTLVRVKGRIG